MAPSSMEKKFDQVLGIWVYVVFTVTQGNTERRHISKLVQYNIVFMIIQVC